MAGMAGDHATWRAWLGELLVQSEGIQLPRGIPEVQDQVQDQQIVQNTVPIRKLYLLDRRI